MSNTKCIPGDIVKLAGIEFVVLDDMTPENEDEQVLLILALKSQGISKFGTGNSYINSDLESSIMQWLGKLAQNLDKEHGIQRVGLVPRCIDLTTLNGYKGYGVGHVVAAPLTLDEVRKYADIIPNSDASYWLATGYAGPHQSQHGSVLVVSNNGFVSDVRCYQPCGMRPALVAPSSLLKKSNDVDEAKTADLSGFTTEELLTELSRRTKN